jgi:hypothetical protein
MVVALFGGMMWEYRPDIKESASIPCSIASLSSYHNAIIDHDKQCLALVQQSELIWARVIREFDLPFMVIS